MRERPVSATFTLTAAEARLQIGEDIDLLKPVDAGSTGVSFKVDLEEGDTIIRTWLNDSDGRSRGAYYVDVYRLE